MQKLINVTFILLHIKLEIDLDAMTEQHVHCFFFRTWHPRYQSHIPFKIITIHALDPQHVTWTKLRNNAGEIEF